MQYIEIDSLKWIKCVRNPIDNCDECRLNPNNPENDYKVCFTDEYKETCDSCNNTQGFYGYTITKIKHREA